MSDEYRYEVGHEPETDYTMQPWSLTIDQRVPHAAKTLYAVLRKHADMSRNNDRGEAAYPSQATIASLIGCTDRAVRNYLATLEETGWVRVERGRQANGHRSLNRYYVRVRTSVDQRNVCSSGAPSQRNVRSSVQRNVRSDKSDRGGVRQRVTTSSSEPADAGPDLDENDVAVRLVNLFIERVCQAHGHAYPKPEHARFRRWTTEMDRLVRLGVPGGDAQPQDPKQVAKVIAWVGEDVRDTADGGFPGWGLVIQSPGNLRQKWSQLSHQATARRSAKAAGPNATVGHFDKTERF